jgi:hypothetical protein
MPSGSSSSGVILPMEVVYLGYFRVVSSDEAKTLPFAFKTYARKQQKKIICPELISQETDKAACVQEIVVDLLTSFSQLVQRVMDRSNSICTTTPHIIPNHNPCKSRPKFITNSFNSDECKRLCNFLSEASKLPFHQDGRQRRNIRLLECPQCSMR